MNADLQKVFTLAQQSFATGDLSILTRHLTKRKADRIARRVARVKNLRRADGEVDERS